MVLLQNGKTFLSSKNMKMNNKTTQELFEYGFAGIQLGAYRLRKEGKYQEAYDELGVVLSLIMQDRDELRKMYKVNP